MNWVEENHAETEGVDAFSDVAQVNEIERNSGRIGRAIGHRGAKLVMDLHKRAEQAEKVG